MSWLLASRWRVLLVGVGLLLALDLGRSLYARVAYATPYEQWDGKPYDTTFNFPPSSNLRPEMSLGEKVYTANCAVCHGASGNGKGISASSIYPRPRDFTQGQFKYKTTAPGHPPSDEDLIRTVANGLPASPMPYFKDFLSAEEIEAVVTYVKGFSPVFADAASEAMPIPTRVTPDDASIARGAELFKNNCAACHGADGRARAKLKDSTGAEVHTRDLTAPWTFRGGSEPEQLWLRVTNGLAPSPMPSFAETLTPEERWDVVNYVLSIAHPAPWEPGGQLQGPRTDPDPHKRGEYLVHTSICSLCHTQLSPQAVYRDEKYLSGGMQVQAYPYGIFVARNLTSDPETGLGARPVEEIANIIRRGQANDRSVNFFGMPWQAFYGLSEEDGLAIATYLKEDLPPVKSRVPPRMEYGALETLIMKIATPSLPVPVPSALTYSVGSYGDPNPGPLPADWPRRVMVGAQWMVLVGLVILFVIAGPREKRFPTTLGGWALAVGATVMVSLCGLVGAVINNLPEVLPAQVINDNTNIYIQPPQTGTPEQVALTQRGYQIFTTISCAFCHSVDGSGGFKVNGEGLGTRWTRNISSDAATGIGAWSDAEIARAIRSGVSRDGRPLYWQGMPWDHFANLDEEDVRAVIAYVRTLPPVANAVPLPAPPGPNDCAVYTFYLAPKQYEPGCQ